MSKVKTSLASAQENIKIVNGQISYYNNIVGMTSDNDATVDSMFQRSDLADFLSHSGYKVNWQKGVYDQLKQGHIKKQGAEFHVKVFTLKKDADQLLRYLPLQKLMELNLSIDLDNYDVIYDGKMRINSLDDICDSFDHHPDENIKPLMVSDIISIDIDGWNYYYIDRRSYQQINVESPSMEMDMNM